jgi:hypothetical protein
MILPTKHIPYELSLIGISSRLLRKLEQPQTVSSLWHSLQQSEQPISFSLFILAIDFLYLAGAVDTANGLLMRRQP